MKAEYRKFRNIHLTSKHKIQTSKTAFKPLMRMFKFQKEYIKQMIHNNHYNYLEIQISVVFCEQLENAYTPEGEN